MSLFSTLRGRLQNSHPDHHAIARGMAWVVLFVFLGKLGGAAKEMAIAYRYGVGQEVDAYLFVFNLISWPVGVWFSVLTVVLVPLVARARQDAAGDLPRFRSELLGFALLLGMGLLFLAWLALSLLLRSSWTGLPQSAVAIATDMLPLLVALVPLGVLISLLSAWMMSTGSQLNTLLEGVPAIVLLVTILVLPTGGVEPLLWGTVAGLAFHLASLGLCLARRGEIESPGFTYGSAQWPSFWRGFGIMLAGQTLMSFVGVIDQFFAARLDTGAIATLGYANRILALALGLGSLVVARATLPIFTLAQGQGGRLQHLRRVAAHWVRLLFVCGIVVAIAGWWLAPWGVKLLFEHGAFSARDTKAVTEVLRYSLVQLPFYIAGLVWVSLLASQQKYKWLAYGCGINLVVKIIANLVFVPTMGAPGIAVATATMYIGSFAVLYWLAGNLDEFLDKP